MAVDERAAGNRFSFEIGVKCAEKLTTLDRLSMNGESRSLLLRHKAAFSADTKAEDLGST